MPATSFPVRPNLARIEQVPALPIMSARPSPHVEPDMLRLALVGGYAPRRCGIATFTTDIAETLQAFRPGLGVDVYVVDDPAQVAQYAMRAA